MKYHAYTTSKHYVNVDHIGTGSIFTDKKGTEYIVQSVLGEVVILISDIKRKPYMYSKTELKQKEFKLKEY